VITIAMGMWLAMSEVEIIEPANGTWYAEVPATLTVEAEARQDDGLAIEEVTLAINSTRVEGQGCDGPGMCTFSIELPAGEHDLRVFAARTLGVELASNVVQVRVGGEPPEGVSTGASETGSTSEPGSGSSEDSTGDPGNICPDAGADCPSNCSCRSGAPSAPAWLVLGLLGLLRRRRINAARAAQTTASTRR
jgi:MYXO-CTERM domain-containing protein